MAADSVEISSNLSYGSRDIVMSGKCYMHINSCVYICGDGGVIMRDIFTTMVNDGSIYTDSLIVEGRLLSNGYIDIAGFMMRVEHGGSYSDSAKPGITYGHAGTQTCPPIHKEIDSSMCDINVNDKTVTITFAASIIYREVDFGDGFSAATHDKSLSHTYLNYNTFAIVIRLFSYCDSEVIYKVLTLDSIYRCVTPTSFSVYPDPCDAYFSVKYESCQKGNYTVPIYDDIGQKVREVSFDNSGTPVKVACDDLAAGIYYIKIPDQKNRRTGAKKIVVVH